MSSPSKKRKLNNGKKQPATQSKGLEYFFSKQKQPDAVASSAGEDGAPSSASTVLTDEELARKLQAEWNQEVTSEIPATHGDLNSTVKDQDIEATTETVESDSTPASMSQPVQSPAETTPKKQDAKKTLSLQSTGMADDLITASIPLDEPSLIFDPSKYVKELQEYWAVEGGNASYALLTRCFVLVSATTSRIKIVDTLVNFLRILIESDPSSLLPAVSLHTKNCGRNSHGALGLACYKFYIPSIYLYGTWSRGLCHFKSASASLWPGQSVP
jgi:DNA ligase-1